MIPTNSAITGRRYVAQRMESLERFLEYRADQYKPLNLIGMVARKVNSELYT